MRLWPFPGYHPRGRVQISRGGQVRGKIVRAMLAVYASGPASRFLSVMPEWKRFYPAGTAALRGAMARLSLAAIASGTACSLGDYDSLGSAYTAPGDDGPDAAANGGAAGSGGAGGSGGEGGAVDGAGGSSGAGVGGGETGNLLTNGNFDTGPTLWAPVGNCSTALSTTNARSADSCLMTTNRTQLWEGPGYPLVGVLTGGSTYRVAVWVRAEVGSYSMSLTYKKRCEDDPAEGIYTQLGTRVVTTDWSELVGIIVAPDCALVESVLYVEAAPVGESYCIDDTSIERVP
jgi:carbohydrate binding protein with CBM4/9 domain